jgi:hypothetical protein
LRGPFGRQPLLQVLAMRVVHEWLHERDLAAAQGTAAPPPDEAVAELLADVVLCALPVATLPRVRREQGVVRLEVAIHPGPEGGPPRQRVYSVDFARRQYGPRVMATPDATVSLTAEGLVLLATHRSSSDDPALGLRVTGARDLAAAVVDAITMPAVHDTASRAQQALPV